MTEHNLAITSTTEVTNIIDFRALSFRFIMYLDVSTSTLEAYNKGLKALVKYLSDRAITAPLRADVIAYKEHLKETGHKPATISFYLTVTRLFFAWLEQENIYPNIASHIKGAKLSTGHKKDYFTATQIKDILSYVDTNTPQGKRDYALIALLATCGLRTIEAERADICDVRTLGADTVIYIQGKGQDEKQDFIRLSPQVEKAIREYISSRAEVSDTAPLFTSISKSNKGERLTTRSIRRIVKGYMLKAGFNSDRLTTHSLRHSAITLSILAGKSLDEVQQFARHSSINTTMIYNHALERAHNSCSFAVADAIFL